MPRHAGLYRIVFIFNTFLKKVMKVNPLSAEVIAS
jgi:hypothetical protein